MVQQSFRKEIWYALSFVIVETEPAFILKWSCILLYVNNGTFPFVNAINWQMALHSSPVGTFTFIESGVDGIMENTLLLMLTFGISLELILSTAKGEFMFIPQIVLIVAICILHISTVYKEMRIYDAFGQFAKFRFYFIY